MHGSKTICLIKNVVHHFTLHFEALSPRVSNANGSKFKNSICWYLVLCYNTTKHRQTSMHCTETHRNETYHKIREKNSTMNETLSLSLSFWSLEATVCLKSSDGGTIEDDEIEYLLTSGDGRLLWSSNSIDEVVLFGSKPFTSQFHRFFCSAIVVFNQAQTLEFGQNRSKVSLADERKQERENTLPLSLPFVCELDCWRKKKVRVSL